VFLAIIKIFGLFFPFSPKNRLSLFPAQDPSEVTFKGNEYLMYNLFEKSGEPILSIRDEVSLFFRTNRPEGLLFYTG